MDHGDTLLTPESSFDAWGLLRRKSSTGKIAGLNQVLFSLQEEADHCAIIHLGRWKLMLPCSSGCIHHCFRRRLFALRRPYYPCNLAVAKHIPHLNKRTDYVHDSTTADDVSMKPILFLPHQLLEPETGHRKINGDTRCQGWRLCHGS